MRLIVSILIFIVVAMPRCSYAQECEYTSLPVESKFTQHGFIWYKQSNSQSVESQGYWQGFNNSYYGKVTSMLSPTNSGCGAISMATIITNCRQEWITPAEIIQYYCDTGLYTGNGSTHNCADKISSKYGLSCDRPMSPVHKDRLLDKDIEISWMRAHLEQGHWIQILVKGTPNVRNTIWPHDGGHFVAIHGYLDGNTYAYDSTRDYLLDVPLSLEEVWENIRNPIYDGCGYRNHMVAVW